MMDKYFEYRKHKTNFKTEVIAGVTTFLTMAYIMFLNPFILSGEFAGAEKGFFDFGGVFTATIVATAIACFIMAFYGKTWPIGLAPGMGINAFVAFGVVFPKLTELLVSLPAVVTESIVIPDKFAPLP